MLPVMVHLVLVLWLGLAIPGFLVALVRAGHGADHREARRYERQRLDRVAARRTLDAWTRMWNNAPPRVSRRRSSSCCPRTTGAGSAKRPAPAVAAGSRAGARMPATMSDSHQRLFRKERCLSAGAHRRCTAPRRSCHRTRLIIPAPTVPSVTSRTCSAWPSPTTRTRAAGRATRRGRTPTIRCARISPRPASRRRRPRPITTTSSCFAHGAGVYEIPVGPVHAGIIEPGHFRFQAVGETGAQSRRAPRLRAQGHRENRRGARPRRAGAAGRARLGRHAPSAHAWAACMAMERAAGVEVPERALFCAP